jgi:hypothetical protein
MVKLPDLTQRRRDQGQGAELNPEGNARNNLMLNMFSLGVLVFPLRLSVEKKEIRS